MSVSKTVFKLCAKSHPSLNNVPQQKIKDMVKTIVCQNKTSRNFEEQCVVTLMIKTNTNSIAVTIMSCIFTLCSNANG